MPKSPEGYQSSEKEIKKAEGMMTPEQIELSERRAIIVGEINARFENLARKHWEENEKFYEEGGEVLSELYQSGLYYKQEEEYAELYAEFAEKATQLYETDPNKAKEFALYAADTYFYYDSRPNDSFEHFRRALEQLAQEMAGHGHSSEIVEIVKNLPTSDGDQSSFKTNLLLRTASSVEGVDRDIILAQVKSYLEPRVTEDYRGVKVRDWHFAKDAIHQERLNYELVRDLFGKEYAISIANDDTADVRKLKLELEGFYDSSIDMNPRCRAFFEILGPNKFAEHVAKDVDGELQKAIEDRKVWTGTSFVSLREMQGKGKTFASVEAAEAVGWPLPMTVEEIKDATQAYLLGAIRFLRARLASFDFRSENYPELIRKDEMKATLQSAIDTLEEKRLENFSEQIDSFTPEQKKQVLNALELANKALSADLASLSEKELAQLALNSQEKGTFTIVHVGGESLTVSFDEGYDYEGRYRIENINFEKSDRSETKRKVPMPRGIYEPDKKIAKLLNFMEINGANVYYDRTLQERIEKTISALG